MTAPNWYMVNKLGMATLCSGKKDAEKEARAMDMAWPHMGPHRAVQLVEAADVETLRAGYDAARLEIESLRARIVEPAGEYPALPEQVGWRDSVVHYDFYWRPSIQARNDLEPLFTDKQMRAYVDADRAMRAAQHAGVMLGEQAELRRLSDCCPELNLSNYGPDDVDELNGWAIEVSQCIDRALAAQHAGAQEPVAWRVHPFDYGVGSEGVYAMTALTQQRDVWERRGWKTEPLYTASKPSPTAQGDALDAARSLFDAGWKACARFCDRDDVSFDGIVGDTGCPEFEIAFDAARAAQEGK